MTTIVTKTQRKMSWWFECLKVCRLHCFTAKQHAFGTISLSCRPSPLRLQSDPPSGAGHTRLCR